MGTVIGTQDSRVHKPALSVRETEADGTLGGGGYRVAGCLAGLWVRGQTAEGLLSGVDLVPNQADGEQPGATTPRICTGL